MIDLSFVEQNLQDMLSECQPAAPYLEIIEQPAARGHRFRYKCEGRLAGSIPGVNSTPENKTFPTIKIHNYKGRVLVRVSCVTENYPYSPHPHNLVGNDVHIEGICEMDVPMDTMTLSFDKLGIQCVKRKKVISSLESRENLHIDPFKTGYEHKREAKTINLNCVRLCFEAFLQESVERDYRNPLPPVVSEPVYDKKATFGLNICRLSHCSAPVCGDTEMILLCDKIAKDNIQIRFFEERNGRLYWEGFGDFQPSQVHHQVAISFRTPRYITQEVNDPVNVWIELHRPSDGAKSEALPFELIPSRRAHLDGRRNKRPKLSNLGVLDDYPLKYEGYKEKLHPNFLNSEATHHLNVGEANLSPSLAMMRMSPVPQTIPPVMNVANRNISILNHSTTREEINQSLNGLTVCMSFGPNGVLQQIEPSANDVFNFIPAQYQQNLVNPLEPTPVQESPAPSAKLDLQQNQNARCNNDYSEKPTIEDILFSDKNSLSNVIGKAMNLHELQNVDPITDFDIDLEELENLHAASFDEFNCLEDAEYRGKEAAAYIDETGIINNFTRVM